MAPRERTWVGWTMWLLPALLLLIVPGCFSMSGPWSVSGSSRGSVTIRCDYDPGWETYKKWWCRGEDWHSCEILVETTGTEQSARRNRVSIQDDHRWHHFTVTIEPLWESDQDTYWCGIERTGTDLGHQVRVHVGPAMPTTTHPTVPPLVTSPTLPVTTHAALPVPLDAADPGTAPTPAMLASSSLGNSLARALQCNTHLVALVLSKMLLLGGLLGTAMWLSRCQRDPKGS